MKQKKDILILPYVFLVVVIAAMFYDLFKLMFVSKIKLFDLNSPLIFGFIVVIGLLVFLVLSFLSDRKNKRAAAASAEEKETAVETGELKKIVLYVLGLILYIILLPRLHFIAATLIFMAVVVFLLNEAQNFTRKLLTAVVSAAIFVPVVYYVFYGIFNVILP